MVATKAFGSPIEQQKGALNKKTNYRQKNTPLCQQIQKHCWYLFRYFRSK